MQVLVLVPWVISLAPKYYIVFRCMIEEYKVNQSNILIMNTYLGYSGTLSENVLMRGRL